MNVKERIMRPIILILTLITSFFAGAQVTNVPDSTDLFRSITDINQQIQRSAQSRDQNVVISSQDALQLQDTIRPVVEQVKPVATSNYVYRNPLDSIYKRKPNGTLALPATSYNTEAMRGLTFRDTIFYNPLFLPMIFNGKILPRDLSFYSTDENLTKGLLIPQELTFAHALKDADFVRKVRREYYLESPDKIKYSVLAFDSIPAAIRDEEVKETFNPFRDLINSETNFSLEAPDVDGAQIERKYWVRSGEHSLQFSQNYFSENWHKGGTNSLNINNYHVFRANYKKEKIKFNNTFEWTLSVFNAPEDSIRKYRIGDDMIRYYGDFGIDAFLKGWSYSTNLEARTQLFNNYKVNSNDLRSAFLSPLYANFGVGLKYQLDKKSDKVRHRRVRWNLDLSPVSIDFRYVGNDAIDVKRFGIEEGRNYSMDIGSSIKSNLIYDITRYITWNSRFTYFTSYKKIVSEFENTLNMALSNAFSTRIYLNVRYDDGVPAHDRFKYWQINETLSFGLNYKW